MGLKLYLRKWVKTLFLENGLKLYGLKTVFKKWIKNRGI